jgi:hypothetical protein
MLIDADIIQQVQGKNKPINRGLWASYVKVGKNAHDTLLPIHIQISIVHV